MIEEILVLVLFTLIPLLELRASIPLGIGYFHMNWLIVFVICVVVNIILGIVIYLLIDKIVWLLTKIKWVDNLYIWYKKRVQEKIHKSIDKWGILGVAIFIGIPLPGSGVYSGALGSYLIGLSFKKFVKACILGVLIAGIIVTLIVLSGNELFNIFIKAI